MKTRLFIFMVFMALAASAILYAVRQAKNPPVNLAPLPDRSPYSTTLNGD